MQGVAKKLTAAIMVIVLAFSMVSTTALTAFADELAVGIARFQPMSTAKSGTLGLGVNWALNDAGHLRIYGNGTIESAYTPGLLGTIGGAVGNNGNDIKSISVEDGVAAPADSGYLFFGLKNVIEVDLHNLDVSGVTNMGCMFANCSSLTDLSSLASWETSNVTIMGTMFSACSSLTDLSPLANWDITKVYSINHMFERWTFLTDLSPLANWDISNATLMSNMFGCCSSLTDLSPLANWNTSNVIDMALLFAGCTSLTNLAPLANWDTSNVIKIGGIFADCPSLSDLSPLANWDTSNVGEMASAFRSCNSLTDLSPIAEWNTSKTYSMDIMFSGCASLADLSPLANWDTSNVTSMSNIFSGCPITKLTLSSKWNNLTNPGLWTPEGGKLTGKWVSPDANMKGPLTTSELIEGWNPTAMAGTWIAEGSDIITPQLTPTQKASLTNAAVLVKDVTYSGKALQPAVNVVLGDKALTAGVDYTVAYANNVNAGTGKVTVTGIGEYTGTKSATFAIAKMNLKSAKIAGLVSKAYTGKAIKQVPTVKLGTLTLKNGRDCTAAYKNNKKVGVATVTVKGKGNFTGTKSATFKIVKHKQPMKVRIAKKTSTVKASSLKKKAITLACPIKVAKAKGKVTFANASTAKIAKTFKMSTKTGKMTIPKATKKGVYTVKVKVTAAGSGQYAYGSKTVTVKIKVK